MPFHCEKCGSTCPSSQELKNHQREHHSLQLIYYGQTLKRNVATEKFSCCMAQCTYSTSRTSHMNNHLRRQHPNNLNSKESRTNLAAPYPLRKTLTPQNSSTVQPPDIDDTAEDMYAMPVDDTPHLRKTSTTQNSSTVQPAEIDNTAEDIYMPEDDTPHREASSSSTQLPPSVHLPFNPIATMEDPPDPSNHPSCDLNTQPPEHASSSTNSFSSSLLPAPGLTQKWTPINYDDNDIATSQLLHSLNCVVYKPLRILICYVCHISIKPSQLLNHRKLNPHNETNTKMTLETINSLRQEYNLFEDDWFSDAAAPVTPVPGIPQEPGFRCPEDGCFHCTTSKVTMQRHVRSTHGGKKFDLEPSSYEQCFVQAIFSSNAKRYRVNISENSGSSTRTLSGPSSHNDTASLLNFMIKQRDRRTLEVLNQPEDRAMLNPLLSKYHWLDVVNDLSPRDVQNWVSLPPREGDHLALLFKVVHEYYQEIIKEMKNTDMHTTMLRWVNSPKSEIVNKPLKVPMRQDTTNRYVQRMMQLLTFSLRFSSGIHEIPESLLLPPALTSFSAKCQSLLNVLSEEYSNSQKQEATHELIMELINLFPGVAVRCPGRYFIIFVSILPSGQFQDCSSINNTLTDLKWTFRATTFWEMMRQVKGLGLDYVDGVELDRVVQKVREGVREDNYKLFSYIMELSHYISVLIANSPRMPRILWRDQPGEEMIFDGYVITITAFRAMYKKLEMETKDILFNNVLLGMKIPDIHYDHIYDDLSNADVGYSFITDRRNNFHQLCNLLLQHLLDDIHGERFFYKQHFSERGGVSWNRKGILEWLCDCERVIGNLFALMHYGSGQPARGTEIATLVLQNTREKRRSFYWYKDFLNVVTMYNKTQTNLEKERVIGRSLPPPIGSLFIIWMALVVPALDSIWTCFSPQRDSNGFKFSTEIFTSYTGDFDTDDFSAILSALSGKEVAKGGLGHSMGVADTRHFLIAIMRKHLKGVANRDLLEEYFNEQSGHDEDAAEVYAVSFSSILNVSDDHLGKFVELSKRQHHLLYPDTAPPSMSVRTANSTSGPSISSNNCIDYHLLASNIVESLLAPHHSTAVVAQFATLLAPGIKKDIAEAFSTVVPHISGNRLLQGHSPHQTGPGTPIDLDADAASGVCVVDTSKIPIHRERHRELCELLGEGARFKSCFQACAVELSARREKDLLVILGTGEGKSLIFMLSAVRSAEAGKVTVVVVPLISLLKDLLLRLKEKGIKAMRWDTKRTIHYDVQVILAITETAASDNFRSYFLKGCHLGVIIRLVIDEIHFLVTTVHYRTLMGVIGRLREGGVEVVGLSASIPPAAVPKVLEAMHMIPGNTMLIRAPTMRKEIMYSVFKLPTRSTNPFESEYLGIGGKKTTLAKHMMDIVSKFEPKERALIFCLTRQEAEFVAGKIGCKYYHAGLQPQEIDDTLESWKRGNKNVLVATSVLGAGFDYSHIKLVIHYGKPRNIIEFVQESGRAGRGIQFAYSSVFWNPFQPDQRLHLGQDDTGVAESTEFVCEEKCRRVCLARGLDGITDPPTCLDLNTVFLCDWCRFQVENSSAPPETYEYNASSGTSIPVQMDVDNFGPVKDMNQVPTNLEGPSMAAQITAAHARQVYNTSVTSKYEISALFNSVRNFLGQPGLCSSCWVRGLPSSHCFNQSGICKSGSFNEGGREITYRDWKRSYQLPNGVCFTCCLPQVSGVHENNVQSKRCNDLDFIRPLLFSIVMSSDLRRDMLESFSLPADCDSARSLTWLLEPDSGHSAVRKGCNFHAVLIWAYKRMSGTI